VSSRSVPSPAGADFFWPTERAIPHIAMMGRKRDRDQIEVPISQATAIGAGLGLL